MLILERILGLMVMPLARRLVSFFTRRTLGLPHPAPDETTSPGPGGARALPPAIVGIADLDGGVLEISPGQPLVVNVEDPMEWQGEVADESVAGFIPGKDDGSAVFNPGFEAREMGSTSAALTGAGGTVYEFTITVR